MILRLLDSDVVIDLQREHSGAAAWFSELPLETVSISGFTAMEMIQSARNLQEVSSADRILRRLVRLWPSSIGCDAAYANYRALHLSHGLGLVDALIAATAWESELLLCTFNIKHFRMIPGLKVEQPYIR